jgi:hypothetical protein
VVNLPGIDEISCALRPRADAGVPEKFPAKKSKQLLTVHTLHKQCDPPLHRQSAGRTPSHTWLVQAFLHADVDHLLVCLFNPASAQDLLSGSFRGFIRSDMVAHVAADGSGTWRGMSVSSVAFPVRKLLRR